MAVLVRFDQPGGAGVGVAGNARDDLRAGVQIELFDAGPAGARNWTLDWKPAGSGAVLTSPTSNPALLNGAVAGETYKLTCTKDGGVDPSNIMTRVIRITKDAAGAAVLGLIILPAFEEEKEHSIGIPGQGLTAGWHPLLVEMRDRILTAGASLPFSLENAGTKYFYVDTEGATFGNATSEADQDGATKWVGIADPSGSPTAGSGLVWWDDTPGRLKWRRSSGATYDAVGAIAGATTDLRSITSDESLTLASDGVEPVTAVVGDGGFIVDADQSGIALTATNEALVVLTGTSARVHSGAGDLGLSCTAGDGIDCRVNGVSCLRVTATDVALGAAVATLSPSIAFAIAPTASAGAGKSLSLKGGAAAAGNVGGALTIGGGTGGTPGSDKFGGTTVVLGNIAGGLTAVLSVESTPGTQFLAWGRSAIHGYTRMGSGAPGSGTGGLSDSIYEAASLLVSANNFLHYGITQTHRGNHFNFETSGAVGIRKDRISAPANITTATTTTIWSYVTEADKTVRVHLEVAVGSSTSNEGAHYDLYAAFKNNGGTVSRVGAATVFLVPKTSFEDAGETGLGITLDFSGTSLVCELTTPNGNTRAIRVFAKITEAPI